MHGFSDVPHNQDICGRMLSWSVFSLTHQGQLIVTAWKNITTMIDFTYSVISGTVTWKSGKVNHYLTDDRLENHGIINIESFMHPRVEEKSQLWRLILRANVLERLNLNMMLKSESLDCPTEKNTLQVYEGPIEKNPEILLLNALPEGSEGHLRSNSFQVLFLLKTTFKCFPEVNISYTTFQNVFEMSINMTYWNTSNKLTILIPVYDCPIREPYTVCIWKAQVSEEAFVGMRLKELSHSMPDQPTCDYLGLGIVNLPSAKDRLYADYQNGQGLRGYHQDKFRLKQVYSDYLLCDSYVESMLETQITDLISIKPHRVFRSISKSLAIIFYFFPPIAALASPPVVVFDLFITHCQAAPLFPPIFPLMILPRDPLLSSVKRSGAMCALHLNHDSHQMPQDQYLFLTHNGNALKMIYHLSIPLELESFNVFDYQNALFCKYQFRSTSFYTFSTKIVYHVLQKPGKCVSTEHFPKNRRHYQQGYLVLSKVRYGNNNELIDTSDFMIRLFIYHMENITSLKHSYHSLGGRQDMHWAFFNRVITLVIAMDISSQFYYSVLLDNACQPYHVSSQEVHAIKMSRPGYLTCPSVQIDYNFPVMANSSHMRVQEMQQTYYYIFSWLLSSFRYMLEFIHSGTCNFKYASPSINISNIAGLKNIVHWRELQDLYMVVFCHIFKTRNVHNAQTYITHITLRENAEFRRKNSGNNCTMKVTAVIVPTTLMREQRYIALWRHDLNSSNNFFFLQTSFENSRRHLFPSPFNYLFNITWFEALRLCHHDDKEMFNRQIVTDIFEDAHLFTYLSELELHTVTDKLDGSGRGGAPLLIFTGFISQSVRYYNFRIFSDILYFNL